MISVDGEAAFILHTRAYKESSLLVDLFTLNYGRVSAVARLSKKVSSRSRGVYQPFIPLKLDLVQSRGSLWTLKDAYMQRSCYIFNEKHMLCAMYVNELMLYLIKSHESAPKLFASYMRTMESLETDKDCSYTLRCFENSLLEFLGYAIDYGNADAGQINPSYRYIFDVENGFLLTKDLHIRTYSGQTLLRIKNQDSPESEECRKVQKEVNKCIIDYLLEGKKLKSRELFSQFLMVK